MAPAKSRKVQDRPNVREEEPVLTFHEGRIRKGQCIRGDVQDRQVKYLVRYPTGSNGVPLRMSLSYPFDLPGWSPPAPRPGAWTSRLSSNKGGSWAMSSLGEEEVVPSTSTSTSTIGMFSRGPDCPVAPEWEYEWVPEARVLRYITTHRQKDSDSALQKAAKELVQGKLPSASSKVQGDRGEGCPSGAPEGQQLPRKHKQKGEPWSGRGRWGGARAAHEHRCLGKLEVQICLPKALRPLLVQDWKLVTMEKQLFILPARKPVEAILAEYVVCQENCLTAFRKYSVGEVVVALQEFFDLVLSSQLLFRFEKLQHCQIVLRHPGARMSQIYGGAHLLRLFLQLGPMLACAPLGTTSLQVLLGHLQRFLKYFASNPSLLFKAATDYRVASAKYQQQAG
ncbi:mortality factor 4-like protein 2 [Monodelphis domestica]|uniref:Mortality factor 4-like protein 2 n=1 Tax=Monodelphis domestica TaxID=13616 RepID=F7BVK1_MONDO|nr:mortality factor 4-like protein 2 [Monodelphis domestica]XP_056665611.1 mortality factor 4-like protein 2 [Monodelphis domestica]